jgi:hypothetical protein
VNTSHVYTNNEILYRHERDARASGGYGSVELTTTDLDLNIEKASEIMFDLKTIWKILDEEGSNIFL